MPRSTLSTIPEASWPTSPPMVGTRLGSSPPTLSLEIPMPARVVVSRPTSAKCASSRRSPVTPRTRSRRRRGKVFDGVFRGSSVHSFQSVNSVDSRWWTTYQPIQSLGSAISASSASTSSKQSKKAPQPLARPLLYRMLSVPGDSNTPTNQASVARANSTALPPRSHRPSARRDKEEGKEDTGRVSALSGSEVSAKVVLEPVEPFLEEEVDDTQFTMAMAITTDDIIHHRHVPRCRYPDIQRSSLPSIRILSPISLDVLP